jgi:SAM-dependent methyltransferase
VKRYDHAYYARFYRDPETRVLSPAERRRRVAAVVALAERWLDRPLRSVLDVGCGPGLWGREILRLRPRASYLGFEPSPAIRARRSGRFEIRRGGVGDLAALPERRRFDLVLCIDVLHYLSTAEVDRALATLVPRARGLLVLEVLTADEGITGDLADLRRRRARWWRQRFARRGLVAVGLHGWLPRALADAPAALERL